MALTSKRALWLATESSYGADPSANGSGYKSVPAMGPLPAMADLLAPEETNYATGRPFPTLYQQGSLDGWTLSGIKVPLIGLASAAGDGTDASSVSADWLDLILTHVFGTLDTTEGEGVEAPDASGLTVDAGDPYDVEDLVAVYEASLPSAAAARTQWAAITADNGTQDYDVAPNWAANPTNAAVAHGVKQYRPNDAGGNSLAAVWRDDDLYYTGLGGRCTALKFVGESGRNWYAELSLSGDSKAEEAGTKTSLPDALGYPTPSALRTLLSPFWFNGTSYAVRKIEIDFKISTAEIFSTAGTGGRAGFQNVRSAPTVTVTPQRTDALLELKRQATSGPLMVQLGAGVLSGGVLNTMCFHARQAQAIQVDAQDDSGIARQQIVFQCTDEVYRSTGNLSRVYQVARA